VILLKLRSNKLKFLNLVKSTDANVSDILLFLNTSSPRDVMLSMNASGELPLTISPILNFDNLTRFERLVGMGP